jgi:asparagine synthase (glutamine-hydrolysing)
MSIFAGIYSRSDAELSDSQCTALRRSVSRHPNETLFEYRSPRFYLVKADVGALAPARGLELSPRGVSVIAGEPLIAEDDRTDCEDLATESRSLHQKWDAGDALALRNANGTFCAAHYDIQSHTLSLFADKLGVRSLYYWLDPQLCVFGTAMRILESAGLFDRRIDFRGLAEVAALQFPLGDRTPYDGLRLMYPAEEIRVAGPAERRNRYWRWDECKPVEGVDLKKEIHRRFIVAVKRRLRNDRIVKAMLSGGMDSRCVVGALHSLGTTLITFNNSFENSYDQVFGREVARRIGSVHMERLRTHDADDQAQQQRFMFDPSVNADGRLPERPLVFWTGEGGSVGLGHVYMDQTMVDLARKNDIDGLIRRLPLGNLPRRIFQNAVADIFVNGPEKGAREEFARLYCRDPGRNVYLYFLANDQRRHVCRHYESLDIRRSEIQMPFYDAGFLAAIVGAPIDLFLRHAFYIDWLKEFPAPIYDVPWQAYPGHVPCPHPVPPGLIYQWSGIRNQSDATIARQAWDTLVAPDFPHRLLKRSQVFASYLLHRFLGGDQEYIFNIASTIRRYSGA